MVPLYRNKKFVGQNTYLEQLEKILFTEHQPPKIAITGLGGVGKTQIVLELAYRTRETHQDCSIFWVQATNAEALLQAFAEIGQQLAIPGIKEKQADVKMLVQRYLSQESASKWLLIIDNVDDMDIWINELKAFLPRSCQGCIVYTTRNRKVAVDVAAAHVIEVVEMGGETAMQLLAKSLINQELLASHQDTQKLLEQLTFLPLAIIQATAYINKNGITLSDYLSLLDEREQDVVELLSEDFEDDGRYRGAKNPVATTWLISFQHIQQLDPLAADYLSFMSCVNPKDIPQVLLPPGPSRKKETDAIGMLNAYSFVSRRTADNALDIHRLVHLVMRNWLRERKLLVYWAAKATQRLEEVFPDNDYKNRSIWRPYLAHARYVLGSEDTQEDREESIKLTQKFARCLYSDGRYNEAEQWFSQVMETRKKILKEEDPNTLASMRYVARALSRQGKYLEAEMMHRKTLALNRKVFGREHINTLKSMMGVAKALHYRRQYMEAEMMYQETLALQKKILGKEHPDTLTSMNGIARMLSHQGKYVEGEKIQRETLALREKVLGKDHPDTLTSMNSLATTLAEQGRYTEAIHMHQDELALSKRVLGEDHPDMLLSMNNLAVVLGNQGNYIEAKKMHQDVLERRKKLLGEEHPNTLKSMNNLAVILGYQGRHIEAEKMHRKTLALRKRVLGEEHPHTLVSIKNLEAALNSQGKTRRPRRWIRTRWESLGVVIGKNLMGMIAVKKSTRKQR